MNGSGVEPARRSSVLLIDDDADIRETISEILDDEGYDVITADHGKAALALLERFTPDLILLDLNMPTMDGLQFRHIQRTHAVLSRIPTVVLSAVGRIEDSTRELGLEDTLSKPVKLPQLLAVVARYCQQVGELSEASSPKTPLGG